ncbi:hypothetical protein [Brevibacillus porteri]|uniref:hypothetical protein n=1 Tax=Brevibacillus porteri TaxID=2126350 RepID=UPI0036430AA3
MKQYVLKTVNHKDEVIEESSLTLKEGSMLIVKVPDTYTYEQAKGIHDLISAALTGERELMTIYEGVKLQTLEIK